MSKRKGRTYERELIDVLEEYGFTVKDTHANAGVGGAFDADLLIWPPSASPAPGWSDGDDPHMIQVEVKYRMAGAGFAKLYEEHLNGYGLGGVEPTVWVDGVASGGTISLVANLEQQIGDAWHSEDPCLNAFLRRAFKPGVDVVACRMARRPWVFIWKDNGGLA